MHNTDTIAGIATANGQGGIAIIRISGNDAEKILESVFETKNKKPYISNYLMYGHAMRNSEKIDECMAVIMRAPKSYTCEDVCEIQTHGGFAAAQTVLMAVLECGARLAEPGEFTRRAFLNGRIDLSQAEAVMSVISASGDAALKAAQQQLEGVQSKFIQDAKLNILNSLSAVEAAIDYPEEIDEEEALGSFIPGLKQFILSLDKAIDERAARIVREGLNVVICGNPNAGKSALFNALLCQDRAIVTDVPGTTRDLLQGSITLNGLQVNLTDTAGLRITNDPVESIGVQRARNIMEHADVTLLALDGSAELEDKEIIKLMQNIDKINNAVVLTKGDLKNVVNLDEIKEKVKNAKVLSASSVSKDGVENVKRFLAEQARIPSSLILTHTRHLEEAKAARKSAVSALKAAQNGVPLDLVSVDLHEALHHLGEITGESVDDQLLDKIFSRFCVGK